jgi:glycerol-3-phosphate dehydrogenase (NAD(P)+)
MTTFAVLGSGGWGTAVALHLAQNPAHRVRLWGARSDNVARLCAARENARLLPGAHIPEAITITAREREATAGADCWIVAIPTAYLRETLARFVPHRDADAPVVSLTKGLEVGTFARPSEIIGELLRTDSVAVLSGPSHAEEVARGLPTSLVVAAESDLAARVQRHFGTERFRVYTNTDVAGVELAGALKNVMGVAAGVCDGLGFGDNAKAALLTRGLVEMTRFGVAHGADPATFHGLAGIGDLITTCFSPHGRNRRVGFRLGTGEPLADVLSGPQVAEGVWTAKSVHERAARTGIETPIMEAVYGVLHAGLPPLAAMQRLMSRAQKNERG